MFFRKLKIAKINFDAFVEYIAKNLKQMSLVFLLYADACKCATVNGLLS